jgi:acyl-coenzyme A synthetase/AMP-(fatty) acid ligase
VDGPARYTYRELHAKSVGMAHILRECGVGLGDMIAVVDGDSIDCVALLVAAMRIGAALALVISGFNSSAPKGAPKSTARRPAAPRPTGVSFYAC